MCGIAGFVDWAAGSDTAHRRLISMLRSIGHRGPDDWGMVFIGFESETVTEDGAHVRWVPESGMRLAIGHRRLSILDLSPAGRQPMWSHDKAYCVSYNGEIYNYLELRTELARNATFRTGTDTEVLLEAYRQWGPRMLERLDGMFAFALWDAAERKLICARDPIGIKPLYFASEGGRFIFASEPKAVLTGLDSPGHIDSIRVAEFLTLGVSDHDEGTSYQEVRQLRAGHWMSVDSRGAISEPVGYWRIANTPLADERNVPGMVREQIQLAVHRQLRSDVPVGSCLSGGLDSGTVAATAGLLLAEKSVDFTTLTLVNRDFDGDESRLASASAMRAGVKWTALEPRIGDIATEIEEMARAMDEPFPSLSMLAQRKIMQQASNLGLKVMLDGQGGDEVFLGYLRVAQRATCEYFRGGSPILAMREWLALRSNASQPLWRSLLSNAFFGSPNLVRWRNARRVSGVVNANFLEQVRPEIACDMYGGSGGIRGLQIGELTRYCLPQLLRFEDRNSMAFGVEARVPLLATGLVDLGLRLPLHWKIRQGWTKYALRVAMKDALPPEIVWSRRKRAFEVPQKRWVEAARPKLAGWLSNLPASCPVGAKQVLKAIDEGRGGEPWLWRSISVALWMQFSGVRV